MSRFKIFFGQSGSAAAALTLTADAGSYAVTGTAATLKLGRKAAADAGSYAVTGSAATLRRGLPIVAGAGSYAVTGTAATPKLGRAAAAAAGSYAVSGTAASLERGNEVVADAGSYSISGQAATFRTNRKAAAAAGSYVVTGQAASLEYGREVVADAGSYAVSGQAASLERGTEVVAGAGTYAVTGTAASLELGREIAADAGSYLVSGQAASLTATSPGANTTLVADAGAYAVLAHGANFPGRTMLRRPGDPLYENSVSELDTIDFIHGTDPDAFDHLEYLGLLNHEMYPATQIPTHIFRVHFGDTAWVFKIALDPAYWSVAEAEAEALRWAPRIGKLPLVYRENILHVNAHPGDATFSSEDLGHYFKGYSERVTLRISNNDFEESCFHEGTHASMQRVGTGGEALGLGYAYLATPAWAAAKAADGAFITDYAATADQEDFAESALFAYTMWLHPERMPESDRTNIAAQIPNRIEFFADIFEQIVACQPVPVLTVASKLPARFISSLEDNTALESHCRDMTNLKVEALYTNIRLAAAGVPDLYRFYCTVCGRVHPRTCIGNEPRAVWEVR